MVNALLELDDFEYRVVVHQTSETLDKKLYEAYNVFVSDTSAIRTNDVLLQE